MRIFITNSLGLSLGLGMFDYITLGLKSLDSEKSPFSDTLNQTIHSLIQKHNGRIANENNH